MGTEAGYTIVNARTIWDAGAGKTIGFCTDQNYADTVVLEHELKSYSIMFSMAGYFSHHGSEHGRISAYVRSDRHTSSRANSPTSSCRTAILSKATGILLKVKLVLKGGKIVVE